MTLQSEYNIRISELVLLFKMNSGKLPSGIAAVTFFAEYV